MNKHKEKYLSGHIKISCYKLMKENLKSHQRCIVFSGEKVEIIPDFTSKKKKIQVRDIAMASFGVLKGKK